MKSFLQKLKRILAILGPGLVTGASDDDPSGIATYSQAGAQFGFATLWTALFTFPLMAAIQGMCARIGLVTSQGLTVTLKQHYPKFLVYTTLLISFPAITLNIGADIEGMGAVAHMLFPQVPVFAFSVIFTATLTAILVRYSYRRISGILKWLCISLLLYTIVPFLVKQDWTLIARKTFFPSIAFNKQYLEILVALLGTTISPYLFFWQTTMEAEDLSHSKKMMVDKRVLNDMKEDVNAGMFLSNLVMFFIILSTGSILFTAGIKQIDTVDQAAKALEPLAGKWAYAIFALGVLGTGLLAIPVLAGSQAYMLAETFNWQEGLDKLFPQAKPFYVSIIISLVVGLCLDFLVISPIKALLYSAVAYGLTAPILIAVILHIGNNRKIMGEYTNSRLSNILGMIALFLMAASAILLVWFLVEG